MSKTVICPHCNNNNTIDVPINKYTEYEFTCSICDEGYELSERGLPKKKISYGAIFSGLLFNLEYAP